MMESACLVLFQIPQSFPTLISTIKSRPNQQISSAVSVRCITTAGREMAFGSCASCLRYHRVLFHPFSYSFPRLRVLDLLFSYKFLHLYMQHDDVSLANGGNLLPHHGAFFSH